MSDYDLPNLPSDKELGITEEDLRAFEEESGTRTDDAPSKKGGKGGGPPAAPGGTGGEDDDDAFSPSRLRGPITLLAMIALAWTASIRTGVPEPVPADGPDTAFSAVRASAALEEIARAPRPAGSPEHARVRNYLLAELRALGLEPEVQTTTAVREGADFARSATVRNVMARLPGSASTGAVLITAHYDGVELSPAAGDDASGLVTILEAVRAVQALGQLRNDVIVLFTDAEELGLLGAEGFVRDHPWLDDVQVVLSFEMRGSGGPSILFETGDGNGAVVRALRDGTSRAFGTSLGEEFFRYMPHATDFTVFERAGKQGLNFAAIDNAAVYHTPRDTPSELSPRTLQQHGIHALGALRTLGQADLSEVRAPDVVYFALPFLGMVVYPVAWVLPVTILLTLLGAGAVFLARRRGARVSAIVIGFGVALVATSLGYGAGWLLLDQTYGTHPEAGQLPGALYYGEGWYVLALAAVALLIVSGSVALARRKLSVAEVTLGGVVLPLVASVVVAFAAPLAAAPLQWPVIAAFLSVLVAALLGGRVRGIAGWVLALLAAVPVFAFFVPLAELLWLAGTLRLAAPLGALMVCGLFLAVPAVEHLHTRNGWWLPLAAILGAGASIGMARLGSAVSPVTPVPTTLAYLYERDTNRGLWISDGSTIDGPESPAYTWLTSRVASPFDSVADLSATGYWPESAPVANAPPATVPPLTLRIQRDTTVGAVRRVTLGLRSEIGAERLYIRRSGGAAGTRIISINGRALTDPYAVQWVDHWGVPDSLVVLGLEMPAASDIALTVSEHMLRPAEILGPGTFQRPPGLQANVMRSSDRAILTTRLGPAADDGPSDGTDTTEPPEDAPADTVTTEPDTTPPDTPPDTASVPEPAPC